MHSRPGNSVEFGAGLIIIFVGVAGLVLSSELPMGTARAMQSGYLPRVVSAALVGIGLVRLAQALLSRERSEIHLTIIAPTIVLASVLAFAVLLKPAGFFLTAVVVVSTVRCALRRQDLRETALLSLGIAVASSALFVEALGIPISLWPQ